MRVFFHSKGIEMVNLSSIMHSKQARLAIPDFFQEKDLPIISYTYTKPIGHTIFNFRKVAREHDINEPLNNQCACKQSNFFYQPLGHVITGDLRVIKNKKLRNLIAKGPNYYILYTTASTSNQIHNACSATGKCLFTQHFIGPTSDGTCETAAMQSSGRGKLSIYDDHTYNYLLCMHYL